MKAAWRKTWEGRGKTSKGISGGTPSSIAEQCDSKWKEVGNGGDGGGSRGGLGVVEQGHGVRWRKRHQPIKLCSITVVLPIVNVICLRAWCGNINQKKINLMLGAAFCIICSISVVFPSKVPSVACQHCEWLGELSAETDQLDLILSDSSWLTAHFTPLCSRLLSKLGLQAWSKLKECQNGANQFRQHGCSAKIQSDYPACSLITDSFLLSCKLSPPIIQVQWQTRHMSLLGQSSAMSKFRSPHATVQSASTSDAISSLSVLSSEVLDMSWSLQDSSSLSPKVSRLQGKVTSWSERLYALGPLPSVNCVLRGVKYIKVYHPWAIWNSLAINTFLTSLFWL